MVAKKGAELAAGIEGVDHVLDRTHRELLASREMSVS
jgi:hypothetical protein